MNYKSFLSISLLCVSMFGSVDDLVAKERKTLKGNDAQKSKSWEIRGNDNINPKKDFLGTSDQTPINISANGIPTNLPYINVTALGQIEVFNTKQGLFIGERAGESNKGENNTFVGYHSGLNTSIEPIFQQPGDNTAFGNSSFVSNTIGEDNTAIGSFALFSTVEASQNTAVGFQSLYASKDGAFNTAVGASSLNSGVTGSFNTAVGFSALHDNAQNFNTAVGFQCMGGNAIGQSNTAVGTNALLNNISGNKNTAFGVNALISNQKGSNNTVIGADSDVFSFSGPLTNATAIGFGAVSNASNKVRIGNMDVETIEGQVEFTTPSDGRFKIKVRDNVPGLSFIMNLHPITYQVDIDRMAELMQIPERERSKMRKGKQNCRIKSGFIAQEVESAAQECRYDFDGVNPPEDDDKGYYGLAYSSFVTPLVKAVQEQQALILEMQKNIEQLNETVQQQQQMIQRLSKNNSSQ